ncbi:serine-rich adhesin for platelets [Cherax quadricarinatus]|nr:putative uncharacterized protein DDB_G0277255 [Cherax quadricarinatus]
MRSGQYKLAGASSKGTGGEVTVVGHFRSNSESPVGDFPHMNSLVYTKNKLSDSRGINKSCENLSSSGSARSAVTRVEQRVKSLLQRGESRLRHTEDATRTEDVWQYGHVVTLPRRPRLSLALSHSALQHLSSDTASCLSGSSGYSSSSSSSYGSFKSSTSSSCSTLPRKKSRSECLVSEGDLPPPLTRSCTLVDNPMYDVMPATDPRNFNNKPLKRRGSTRHEPLYDLTPDSDPYNVENCQERRSSPSTDDPIYDVIPGGDTHSSCRESLPHGHNNQIYDLPRPSRLLTPDSGTHGGLDSLEESALDSLDCSDPQNAMLENEIVQEEDKVAKECREYFERRLKNSETLKKRWSMCSTDSGADSGDSDVAPTSLQTSGNPSSIASNTSSTSDVSSTSHNASNTSPSDASNTTSHSSSTPQVNRSSKKTPLDQKMEFLRKEIASLMKQDNALFRQLLTLHDSISALKITPAYPHRPSSPASLDSFTEEEEDEDDDDEEEEDDQVVVGVVQKTSGREDNLSDVDEGLEIDHSTSHSNSPTSTLSSNSSRDSQFSRYSSEAEYHRPHHLKTASNTSQVNTEAIHVTYTCNKNRNNDSYTRNLDKCNTTAITNFTNKISRYSITTNEDFNINISINTDDSSSISKVNPQSSSSSPLSKSSCYLYNSGQDTNDLAVYKTFGGSLGSFSPPERRHFVRTRVSIPPSARNRDRSARPESFRLSSDMATHTRVLLKARSFAGASLRESPTHKMNGEINFARTSLREDQLTYHRKKAYTQQKGMSKMEFLRARFANTFEATSGENASAIPSNNSAITNSKSRCDANGNQNSEFRDHKLVNKDDNSVSVRPEEGYTYLDSTNISTEKPLENYEECWKHGNSELIEHKSTTKSNTFAVKNDDHYIANKTLQDNNTLSPSDQHLSPKSITSEKAPGTHNLLIRKASLTILNSYQHENSQDSVKLQKIRTRSFTGMVTPLEVAPNQESPREVLSDREVSKEGTLSLRVTQGAELERIARVATMTRRARVIRDGYAFRFSSDLGLGASSKVKAKSKREVFV